MLNFGDRIRLYRGETTLEVMAEECQTSFGHLSQIERGKMLPTAQLLNRIANYLRNEKQLTADQLQKLYSEWLKEKHRRLDANQKRRRERIKPEQVTFTDTDYERIGYG